MKKLVFLLIAICACEFRISDEYASKELGDKVDIHFGDLTVEDRNMHYAFTDQGKSKLLVFVHGSPGSWNAFIAFFKADSLLNEFDMLAVDRAGFGLSGFGKAEPSLKIQALQINEVLCQFPDKSMILIGHSLGGPVIARMAMDYPCSYEGLLLIAPSVDPNMEEKEWYRGIINTQLGALFTPKEFEVSNDEIMPLKKELEEMIPLWSQLDLPTIVLHGTDDSLVPKENTDFLREMLPDSVIDINLLEGVDHFIPWTHPEEIIKAIRQLADSLDLSSIARR